MAENSSEVTGSSLQRAAERLPQNGFELAGYAISRFTSLGIVVFSKGADRVVLVTAIAGFVALMWDREMSEAVHLGQVLVALIKSGAGITGWLTVAVLLGLGTPTVYVLWKRNQIQGDELKVCRDEIDPDRASSRRAPQIEERFRREEDLANREETRSDDDG